MEENMQKKTENYLLFVPSTVRQAEPVTYTVNNEEDKWEPIDGVQTNEAVTKYLIDKLRSEGQKLDKIIMLCTKEVREQKPNCLEGKTTLEYFSKKILDHMRKNIDNPEDEAEILPLDYDGDDTGGSGEILSPLLGVVGLTADADENVDKRIYIDFSGGTRTAALTLIFACRILQAYDMQVEKIMYSKLLERQPRPEEGEKGKKGKIIDCTKTYRLFDYLAAQLEQEYGGTKRSQAYTEQELGNNNEVKEILDCYRALQRDIESNQFKTINDKATKILEKIETYNDTLPPLGKEIVTGIKKEAKRFASIDSQDMQLRLIKHYLEKERYQAALNLYRAEFIPILYTYKILDVSSHFKRDKNFNKNLTKEILGAYCYYAVDKTDKKYIHKSFLTTVKEYILHLKEDKKRSPEECRKQYYGAAFNNPAEYVKNGIVPQGNYNAKIMQKERKEYLEIYLQNAEKIDQKDIDSVYMLYGFPFAYVYDGYCLEGYGALYKTIFNKGKTSLENFYHGKKDRKIKQLDVETYEELIDKLSDGQHMDWVRKLFPFRINPEHIFPHSGRTEQGNNDQWDEFMYDFASQFYDIKQVRNRVIHPGDLKEGKFEESIENIKVIVDYVEKIKK